MGNVIFKIIFITSIFNINNYDNGKYDHYFNDRWYYSFLVSKMVCSSVVNLMLSTNLCKNYPSRTRSYKHIDITIGSIAPLGLQYILNLLHHDFRITKHTTP